jgi:hypothetical protein
MVSVGSLGLLIFTTLGGAFTLGIPPGEMDLQLQQIAPRQCLLFHQWAGASEADPESQNRLEQLIAEPDMQRALVRLSGELEKMVSGFASRDKSPGVAPFVQLLVEGSKILYGHSGAAYVWPGEDQKGLESMRGALVIHAGKDAERLDRLLTDLLKAVAGENVVAWPSPAGSFQKATIMAGGTALVWGQDDGYLIVALGEQAAEDVLKRWDNKTPAWLADLLKALPMKRRATISFVELQQGTDLLGTRLGSRQLVDEALVAIGLDNLRHAAFTTGISGPDWISHGLVTLDGEPHGPLKTLTASGLSLEDLDRIPADVLLAVAGQINLDKLYGVGMDLARTFNPRAGNELNEIVQLFQEQLGLQLREDLFQSLGESWILYCSRHGSLATGWTATAEVKNRQALEKVVAALARELENMGANSPRLHKETLGSASLFILDIPDDNVLVLPSLAITDKQVVIGLYPQAVRGHLRQPETALSLADNPSVRELFVPDRRMLGMAVTDNKSLFEFAYPLAQVGIHLAATKISRNFPRDGKALALPGTIAPGRIGGSLVDASFFPPANVISRHLGQERVVLYMDSSGIHIEQRGDLPGHIALPALLPFFLLNSSPARPPVIRETIRP